MKLSSPETSFRQLVHHAVFLCCKFLTTPKLKKFLKVFILQINTTRADFVSQGMNHAEGMMTKCFADGTGLQNILQRVHNDKTYLRTKKYARQKFR